VFIVCQECPLGFIDSLSSCYRVITDNLPWSVAALRCQALHPKAHLVAIDNELEQYTVNDIINERLESKTKMLFVVAKYFLLLLR